MRFEQVRLRNFRNYRDLRLDLPSGVVIFTGANGQGKTNLIEAFYLLLRGESFRPSNTTSFIGQSTGPIDGSAQIEARLFAADLHHDLRLSLLPGERRFQWNGKKSSWTDATARFPLVLFSPESLAAIKEGPDLRRQLLDDTLLTHDPANGKVLKDFRKVLRTRNRVLKDLRLGHMPEREGQRLLDSLDPSYLPLATALVSARMRALSALAPDLTSAAQRILALENVDISVEYLISGVNAVGWTSSDILSAMHNRAHELRSQEIRAGASLVGPQKHDVRFLFSGKDSRFFCSQGQQRALILSFKMAQILYHYRAHQIYPLLFLDDVLSELDPVRRSNLVAFLRDLPAQIFLTTTDLSFSLEFGDRRLAVFGIDGGKVCPI